MGDIIELTTWPKMQFVFYKVTSSALWFEVKTTGCAAVILSRQPGTKYKDLDYLVAIDRNRTWLRKLHEADESEPINIPGLSDIEEFRRFWLTWDGNLIKLGRDNDKDPIVKYKIRSANLQFVTFAMVEGRGAVRWRFELPPMIAKPKLKPVSGGKPEWVTATDELPDGTLIGGYEGETLYIIRAHYRGSLTPGKFVPSKDIGYIPWGGRANPTNQFDVLCGFDCIWVSTTEDKIPVGAVVGGHAQGTHEPLYIGRTIHEGHLIPGKVQPSHKVCYIAYEDKEVASKEYEILITPNLNPKNVKRYVTTYTYDVEEHEYQQIEALDNHDYVSEESE